jgi:phosphopantetheine--protein transferase-like protein
VGIKRMEVFSGQSIPYEGEMIPVAHTTLEGPEERTVFRFDGVIRDRDGRSIIALKGVEAVELERSPGFPRRVFEEIVALEEVVGEQGPAAQDRLADILDDEEAQEHAGKTVPKRAGEWLAGRTALKKSVGRLLATADGQAPVLKNIRIVPNDQGKPAAELSHRPGIAVAELSLSHSNGLAIAAAAAPGDFVGLGVDLEKVAPRNEAWIADYFTEEEIRAAGDDNARWLELTRMWCLKEAALKAMGTGLRFDLRNINVVSMDRSGRACLEFRNEAAQHLDSNSIGSVEARVEEKKGLVLARVVMR